MTWREFVRGAPAKPARRRFLHRRDDVAAKVVRALLHRTGQPSCARRGLYAESERAVGNTTGPVTDMDGGRTPRIAPFPDSRSGPEIHRQLWRRVSKAAAPNGSASGAGDGVGWCSCWASRSSRRCGT